MNVYFTNEDVLHEILELYCQGVTVLDISAWTSVGPDDVNAILDHFAPHL